MDLEEALNQLGTLKDGNQFLECIALCEQLILAYPGDARPHYELAWVYARTNDAQRALSSIDEAINRAPEEPAFRYFAGLWCLESAYWMRAVRYLDSCIALEQKLDDIYYLSEAFLCRAIARLKLEDYELAIQDCNHVDEGATTYIDRLYNVNDVRVDALRKLESRQAGA